MTGCLNFEAVYDPAKVVAAKLPSLLGPASKQKRGAAENFVEANEGSNVKIELLKRHAASLYGAAQPAPLMT